MNKYSNLAFALAASTAMLIGCNSDEVNPSKTSGNSTGFHATLTISLPAGTRSSTVDPGDEPAKSDAGFEIGNASENNVGSVIVVLASYDSNSKTYSYITSNLADAVQSASQDPIYSITFETGALTEYAEKEVGVFAYCNPTTQLKLAISDIKANKGKDFADLIGNSAIDMIAGGESGFLMSNASIHRITLPSQELMENTYDKPEKAYDLGTVRVERATARFDFKEVNNNFYPIKDVAGHTMAYVQLEGMALLNEANSYYYLPRVSANGFNTDVTICGQETPFNYVVSPNADQKTASNLNTTWIGENYRDIPTYKSIGVGASATVGFDYTQLEYTKIANFEGLGEDNDDNWTLSDGSSEEDEKYKKGYHIWKYVTENTIPEFTHDDITSYQRKGVTTGVVFKGYIVAGTDTESELASVINAGEKVIYAYGNVLYGDLDMLKKAVLANPVSSLAETFKAAYDINDSADGPSLEAQITAVEADLTSTTAGGFAIYRPTARKYVMYYSYWNRHNDNRLNTIMRPMEFSVVRNNVYKLSVQDIVSFGHPGDPGDDPDPDEPDDPDETPKIYFTVEVQVIPWVVRVNNIVL